MAHHNTRWYFLVAPLLVVPSAFAQTGGLPVGSVPPAEPPLYQRPPGMQQPPTPQTRNERVARLRTDCGQDFARLCRGTQPGGGRIIKCLLAHRSVLSPACRSDLAGARAAPALAAVPSALPPATLAAVPPPSDSHYAPPPSGAHNASPGNLKASCGPDVQRLCASAPKDNIVKCLMSHRNELSGICTVFLQEKRAPRAAQKSTLKQQSAADHPTCRPGSAAAGASSRYRRTPDS